MKVAIVNEQARARVAAAGVAKKQKKKITRTKRKSIPQIVLPTAASSRKSKVNASAKSAGNKSASSASNNNNSNNGSNKSRKKGVVKGEMNLKVTIKNSVELKTKKKNKKSAPLVKQPVASTQIFAKAIKATSANKSNAKAKAPLGRTSIKSRLGKVSRVECD
jgi:hypothetical protein